MAQRRMITKSIFLNGEFLRMSRDAQILYLASIVHADDEGIVDVYPVMQLLSISSLGVFREIVDAKFMIRLSERDSLIALVTEWDQMNHVPQNRFVASKHHELKVKILSENERMSLAAPPINGKEG